MTIGERPPHSALEARGGPLPLLRAAAPARRRGIYDVRRIVHPGDVFDADERRALMRLIVEAARRMFDGVDVAPYYEHRANYLGELTEWWVAEHDDELVGWAAIRRWDGPYRPILYMDTLGILPEHRRGGLGALLSLEPWLQFSYERRAVATIGARTENPVVARMVHRFGAADAYPRLGEDGKPAVSAKARAEAAVVAATTSPGKPFDDDALVIRGALDFVGSLYGSTPPPCGDRAIDAYFRTNVTMTDGDSAVLVVRGTPRFFARGFLGYTVTRGRLAAAALHRERVAPQPS
jgi:GNAT superfamily N-acetyltransferase